MSGAASAGNPRLSALWLTLGTFTALPVPAPAVVDRRVAGTAMAGAPLTGVVLAVVPIGIVAIGTWLSAPPLLVAALVLGTLALSTRGLHLDGLADTADGLAASYDRAKALTVMRRGDTGPAGTAALVLVLLIQVAALSAALTPASAGTDASAGVGLGAGVLAVAVAVLTGRAVVSLACVRGIPAARPEGLGATVAESVSVPAATAVGVVVAALSGVLSGVLIGVWWLGPAAVAAGYLVAVGLLRRCVRRLGGVTGDVIGACVEASTTAALAIMGGLWTF